MITGSIEELSVLSLIIRLLLATLFGAIIGLERGARGQSAGIRTFALVCVGAASCAIVNLFLFYTTGSADTARIPSTVITGVGFLGVGTIVAGRTSVRGLTTAATMWSTAALGLLIGSGFLVGSIVCFLTIVFIVVVLNRVSLFQENIASRLSLYLELDRETGVEEFLSYMNEHGYSVSVLEKKNNASIHSKDIGLYVTCNIFKHKSHTNLINDIFTLSSVHYVEEIKG
ncbi:MAG: MgtC/SapB family protein [Lachnospiraceae bacterium]|nr:MgtC/SapB family protein [Lachnospiraceae bacterium]MBO7531399.1 MgtC/SapB family protein [Lachnospiraceae bacterium]